MRAGDGAISCNGRGVGQAWPSSRVVFPLGQSEAGGWRARELASTAVSGEDVAVSGGESLAPRGQRPWRARLLIDREGPSLAIVQAPRGRVGKVRADGRGVSLVEAHPGAQPARTPAGRRELDLPHSPREPKAGMGLFLVGLRGAASWARRRLA